MVFGVVVLPHVAEHHHVSEGVEGEERRRPEDVGDEAGDLAEVGREVASENGGRLRLIKKNQISKKLCAKNITSMGGRMRKDARAMRSKARGEVKGEGA